MRSALLQDEPRVDVGGTDLASVRDSQYRGIGSASRLFSNRLDEDVLRW